jgi:Bacterial Ig-like domain (group 2)
MFAKAFPSTTSTSLQFLIKHRLVLFALTVSMSLLGCGGSSYSQPSSNSGGGVQVTASVVITPTSSSISTDGNQQFTATAKDISGNTVSGVAFLWTSSATTIATIDNTGLVTANTAGTTQITASVGGVTSAAVTLQVIVPLALLTPILPPVGPKATGTLVVGNDEVNVLSNAQELQIGTAPLPDLHQTYLQFNDGKIRFWVQGGGGTSEFTTTDFGTFTTRLINGRVSPVLGPSSPLTSAFDADYAGGSSVFPAANKTDLLMIYHAENHYGQAHSTSGVTPFYASIGIARSSDGGKTWSRQGPIITGREPQGSFPPPATGLGAGNPSAIITNGFIYVFFQDTVSPTGPFQGQNHHCLARAPIASDGAVGSWQKLYNGSFAQPGVGGLCEQVVPLPPASTGIQYVLDGDVNFNAALNAYLDVFLSDDGFFYSTSSDMVTWSSPILLFQTTPARSVALITPGAPYYYYPTLITPSASSDELTGASGFVFYAKGTQDTGLTQSNHSWFRRSYSIH